MEIPFLNKFSLGNGLALFKKESGVLGIDFGSANLKIVQLKKGKTRPILETYGEIATGPYAQMPVGKSVRLVDTKAVEMISDLLGEARAKSREASVSIPLRSSFVKIITLPLISEKEITEAIPYEVRKHIPVPLDEVIINWWILPQGEFSKNQGEEGFIKEHKSQEVLLAAIHRDLVQKYQNIFKGAEIGVKSFEIEIFGNARSALNPSLHPSLIIDLGAQTSRYTVIDYGLVRLAHTLDSGSADLTDSISKSLGVDFVRAERLKQDIGFSQRPENKEIRSVIEPVLEYILSEGVRVSSEYGERSGRKINKVCLIGGGALLGGVVEFAINKFGLEVERALPFNKVEHPAFLEDNLKQIGPVFATALGAAMRALEE
ncbi:pilus assembly protein PilM [Candidatus Giovannonibacteria bacterium]|nr:pilus assembly protein PilM [Candidatus Giovannonibacteria bacterium]